MDFFKRIGTDRKKYQAILRLDKVLITRLPTCDYLMVTL